MQKFCKKCGNRLDDKTGRCPNCDKSLSKKEIRAKKRADKKAAKKAAKKEAWQKLPLGKKFKKICLRIVIVILLLAVLTGAGVATLVYFDIVDIPAITAVFDFFGIKGESEDSDSEAEDDTSYGEGGDGGGQYSVERPDADEYFQNNSTVLSEVGANESDKVISESEAYNTLIERGFVSYPIFTEYSMNGEYSEAEEISQSSTDKHPMYQTIYQSESGDFWTIYLINGAVMAYPVSYNADSELNTVTAISESDSVMSYDSTSNKFYETIPDESEMIIKKVGRIDAETLEQLNTGAIDEL